MDGKKICKIILYISGFIFYSLFWIAMLWLTWVIDATDSVYDVKFVDQLIMTAIIGAFWIVSPLYGYIKLSELE